MSVLLKKNEIPLWRQIQRKNFFNVEKLADFLELSPKDRERLLPSAKFSLNLPYRLAEKMEKGTLEDPILRQFVPLKEELIVQTGFSLQPVEDPLFQKRKKLLQKYQGRALILTTSACAMHCRFCFRQNFPYETAISEFEEEISYLKNDPDLHEVILSGGDPLSLSHLQLEKLLTALNQIPHLRRIRFHTRFPIGIPERIDSDFLKLLEASPKQLFFILHCNHPLEIDNDIIDAMKKIRNLGIPVLNQAVLLKGVNDREETLLALSETLVDNGILPYYLHQLDLVEGASHFAVSDERAHGLIAYLQNHTSGYAVPKLVREIPGELSKSPIPSCKN